MLSPAQIIHNKEQRELAELFLAEVKEPQSVRFWECVVELAQARLRDACLESNVSGGGISSIPPAHTTAPMTYVEAADFHRQPMPQWSKYHGSLVADVPKWYFLALSDTDPFTRLLNRYVRSRFFQDLPE